MRRRDFLGVIGSATTWPLAARAQLAVPVVAFLHGGTAAPFIGHVQGFRRGLHEAGYEEGHNVDVEYHWADGHYDRMPTMATEMVLRKVSVIAVGGGAAHRRSSPRR